MARQGNNPKRRIVAAESVPEETRERISKQAIYLGSANHKRSPGNYGFHPPSNPRPWKSICDGRRQLLLQEAEILLRNGIAKGMMSEVAGDGMPKYIWRVDEDGVPYEAKVGNGGYHGYPLYPDDEMSAIVLREWSRR